MPPAASAARRRTTAIAVALLSAAAVLAPPAAGAAAETYAIDPVHTRVVLAVDHAGFSKAIGTVSGSTGTLLFDPDDWTVARVEVEIPLARLDFGDAKWNAAVLARNLLDGERHPVARFASARVEPVDATRARVHGQLSVRGESRAVVLDVVLNALKRHPLPPFRRTAGFSATATLSRADFGIDAWKSVIGDAVELRIEAEATRSRGGAEPADGDAVEPGPEPSANAEAEAAAAAAAAAAGAADPPADTRPPEPVP